MKRAAKWRYRATARITFHPHIHPEDAEKAYWAWFNRTMRERKKLPHVIGDKAIIASVFSGRKRDKLRLVWTDREGKPIVPPAEYKTRWERARKDGRAPILAPADHSNRRRTPQGYAVWEIHPVMKMDVVP